MNANERKNSIDILVQGFYGNRTGTTIDVENLDTFMLGYLDRNLRVDERIDRTAIKVPGTDNLYIIYNKYQEEDALSSLQQFVQKLRRTKQRFNPTAVIPELGIVLYSRCIVCRMDESGNPLSMEAEDFKKVLPYLAQ